MINQAYTPSTNGLQSYIDAAPSYELAPIGIASMQDQAQKLAEFGRNGDLYVVHAAEGETVIPMEVLEANPQIKALLFNQMTEMGLDPQRYVVGDQLNSLNPVTGMPEFFFKSIFKGIKKAVKSVVKVAKKIAPVALPIIGATIGLPFLGPAFAAGSMASMALTSGIGTLVGGGSLKDAFKSALTAGATAGIFGALKGATPSSWGFGGSGPSSFTMAKAKEGFKQAALGGYYTPPSSLPSPSSQIARPENVFSETTISDPTSGLSTLSSDPLAHFASAPLPDANVVQNVATVPSLTDISTTAVSGEPPVAFNMDRAFGGLERPPEPTLTWGTTGPPAEGLRPPLTVSSDLLTAPRPPTGTGTGTGTALSELNTEVATILKHPDNALLYDEAVVQAQKNIDARKGLFGLPKLTESKWQDAAIYGTGAYLGAEALGAFDVAEEEEITEEDRPDIGGGRVLTLAERLAAADKRELEQASINPFLFTPSQAVQQPTIFSAAQGGSIEYPRRELLVEGPGTEKSDDIPSMLSDGEFVITAKGVRGADPSGRGNRYAGSRYLYNLMRNFEMRA